MNLKSLTLDELRAVFISLGLEDYRAVQVFEWLWKKGVDDVDAMTNLSKPLREKLKAEHSVGRLVCERTAAAGDGTRKFLYRLEDDSRIESVLMQEEKRTTVCVSTQVGCPVGCVFCFTGQQGFVRNLAAWEIADQVIQVQKSSAAPVTNVVMMGMGEPFLNYDETVKAVEILNHDLGPNIGARRITVSTVGIAPRILDFAGFPLQAKLAISLNAADDDVRSSLIPVNRKYPLKDIIEAVKSYVEKKNKRVTFEYLLIKDKTDRRVDALHLTELLRGIPCKVNLIPLNPFPGSPFRSPTSESVDRFARLLYPELPAVTVRKSKGAEVMAGCGQLTGKI